MATLQQQLRRRVHRQRKLHWNRIMALGGNPQKRGVVQRVALESPKKPNSGQRRVARVRFVGGQRLWRVKVRGPGPGGVNRFSAVLMHGHHGRDIKLRYGIIPGKLGASPLFGRRKAHSKFGLKKRAMEEFARRSAGGAAAKRKKLPWTIGFPQPDGGAPSTGETAPPSTLAPRRRKALWRRCWRRGPSSPPAPTAAAGRCGCGSPPQRVPSRGCGSGWGCGQSPSGLAKAVGCSTPTAAAHWGLCWRCCGRRRLRRRADRRWRPPPTGW